MFNECEHETGNHPAGEHDREMANANGNDSFWSMRRRGHESARHRMPPKGLQRYITGFAGQPDTRDPDTLQRMVLRARGMDGRLLPWKKLTAQSVDADGP